MRPNDAGEAARLSAALLRYEGAHGPLPGVASAANRTALIEQLIESERRRRFVQRVSTADLSPLRADPSSTLFDPLKAAAIHQQRGETDESFWMVFLFVHFGRSRGGGWRYARDVYSRLGTGRWDWPAVSADPAGFRSWLTANATAIKRDGPGGFGNHRKYESLAETGEVVETYVSWVGPERSHAARLALGGHPDDARLNFAEQYLSMAPIARFGRTARFDYLTTVGRLGLADLVPDRAHLESATGPWTGARLLFGSAQPARELDQALVGLGDDLELTMDVVEDGVCNWQKSPAQFRPFRG